MLQSNLFDHARKDDAISIPGLHYCSNYIDEAEQQELLGLIDQQQWLTD